MGILSCKTTHNDRVKKNSRERYVQKGLGGLLEKF